MRICMGIGMLLARTPVRVRMKGEVRGEVMGVEGSGIIGNGGCIWGILKCGDEEMRKCASGDDLVA